MRELQYQISTGRWVDCVDDETEKFLALCERATGKSRQEVLSALEAGKKVRYDPEDWYSYCRLKPAPKKPVEVEEELTIDCPTCHGKKEWVDIESRTITLCPDCNDLEPEQAMVKCDYCGRSVPAAAAINASLGTSCPDCYRD
jgi:hypothetical protein